MTARPRIETERLTLRAHTPDDLPVCARMWSDADVVRFIGGRPFSREEVWARLLRYAGMWAVMGHGFWAIEEKASSQLIGEVGIMEARRDIEPSFEGEPEVGWALMPAAHGKGYAAEAVGAALGWGDKHIDARNLCASSARKHALDQARAEVRLSRTRAHHYHGSPTVQFERLKHG